MLELFPLYVAWSHEKHYYSPFPPDGMLVHRRGNPDLILGFGSTKWFTGSHLYTRVERDNVGSGCLSENNTVHTEITAWINNHTSANKKDKISNPWASSWMVPDALWHCFTDSYQEVWRKKTQLQFLTFARHLHPLHKGPVTWELLQPRWCQLFDKQLPWQLSVHQFFPHQVQCW